MGQSLSYFVLINSLMQEIDPTRFNMNVLDEVFSCFITDLGNTPTYNGCIDVFKNMKVGEKLRQPVLFSYENNEWHGKLIWEKWENNSDNGAIWNTFSIKLPNDGYIYNKSHQVTDQQSKLCCMKDDSIQQIPHAIQCALDFFEDENISARVFYMTNKSRLNIKVKSEKYKAWLRITYEYGCPKQSNNNSWYSKQKMIQLLHQEKY